MSLIISKDISDYILIDYDLNSPGFSYVLQVINGIHNQKSTGQLNQFGID